MQKPKKRKPVLTKVNPYLAHKGVKVLDIAKALIDGKTAQEAYEALNAWANERPGYKAAYDVVYRVGVFVCLKFVARLGTTLVIAAKYPEV